MYKTVGAFNGEVSSPSPCWCEIKDDRGGSIRFDHRKISDLEYLVSEMKKEAIRKLGKHAHEV